MSKRRGKLQFLFLILFIFPLAAQVSSLTSDGYIRDWQYDGDHVAYTTENGSVTSIMTVDDEKLIFRKYDERHRLISETVWENGYEKITSETTWVYQETGVYPLSMNKTLPEQDQLVKVLYSETGCETARAVWKKNGDSAETLLEKTVWEYDGQNRILLKLHEVYDPEKKEKTEYTYTDMSSEPDMMYFEDDVLVEKITYVSEDCYEESLFFEDMEIRTTWKAGVKTDEVYYLEGQEIKRKPL